MQLSLQACVDLHSLGSVLSHIIFTTPQKRNQTWNYLIICFGRILKSRQLQHSQCLGKELGVQVDQVICEGVKKIGWWVLSSGPLPSPQCLFPHRMWSVSWMLILWLISHKWKFENQISPATCCWLQRQFVFPSFSGSFVSFCRTWLLHRWRF